MEPVPVQQARAERDLARVIDVHRTACGTFASHYRVVASTTSTNDDAKAWAAAGAPEGAWIAAREQTAGRGRQGRPWASPAAAGLYLSVVFRPAADETADAPATALLTLMCGVAVAHAVRGFGAPASLKWPNDVVVAPAGGAGVSRRKLAGILAEGVVAGGRLEAVVAGIGLNLVPAAYPPDIASRAISLAELVRPVVSWEDALVAILQSLALWRARLSAGQAAVVLDAWRALAPSATGAPVRWRTRSGERRGRTAGVDERGALLIETETGRERIVAGDVSWD